jgi:long-chain acyl-CoA synthetase
MAQDAAAPDPRTVPEMFSHRLGTEPDAQFLLLADGRSWTFRELEAKAGLLAGQLAAAGVTAGDVVGLYQWNDPSWFVSALATWRLGAVVAGVGSLSPTAEADRRFTLVNTKVIVSSEPAEVGDLPVIQVGIDGTVVHPEALPDGAAAVSAADADPEGPAAVFFTSGTTGNAKAVLKLHGQLAQNPRQTAASYSRSPSFRPRMAAAGKPPTLSFNPFGQAAAIGRLVFRLYIGRPLIMIRKFDVDVVRELASRFQFDTLQLTPAMVHSLAFTELDINLGSLQYVNSGTAPLPITTRDAFERRYGVPVLQAYGSTEGGVMALERYDDVMAGRRGPGAVGRISPDSTWRIVTGDGRDAEPGAEGEILGKPPSPTLEEAGITALPLDTEGWYHTGDLGRVDEHGILYITGRAKDMLITGGFNVHPAEVEDALRDSPLVRDALVVGLPDDRLGEIAAAALVWEPGELGELAEPDAVAQVIAHARAQLAAYKVPRRWLITEAIPLSPGGKPDRLELGRMAAVTARSTAEMTAGQPAPAAGSTDGPPA